MPSYDCDSPETADDNQGLIKNADESSIFLSVFYLKRGKFPVNLFTNFLGPDTAIPR